MELLGKYVCVGEKMSFAQKALLLKVVENQSLNNCTEDEQHYLHLIIKNMLQFCLNVYILKENLCHVGTRDDVVLSRKVPGEFWKLLFDTCVEMGVSSDMLISERRRAGLWLHFNSRPELLQCVLSMLLGKMGVKNDLKVNEIVLTDGNFLFNLGSVLPNRMIMILCYCLAFWGKETQEPWVRFFTSKIFILFLVISGHLLPQKNWISLSATTGYTSFIEIIMDDIKATLGVGHPTATPPYDESLDYLFTFNNSVLC